MNIRKGEVMKIAMGQISMSVEYKENIDKTMRVIEECCGDDILFFPEIQLSPFFPQYLSAESPFDAKEYLMTESHQDIKRICEQAKNNNLFISPNVYLQKEGNCYDASLWITPDGEIEGISTMVHVMQAENFYEKDYYTPSSDGFKVYDTPFGKVGIVICFDRHLPESIRTCALLGAQLIIVPTANLKSEPLEMFEWEMRVQAMQNNVFIAMCNRVGIEGELEFAGESIVIGPDGEVIIKADDKEKIVRAEIDLDEAVKSREKRPYIKTRRPEMY